MGDLKDAVIRGDPKALYIVGLSYATGQGVPKNLEKAVKWYLKAAIQGHAEAQYLLGHCYYYGRGVMQNIEDAAKWFRNASKYHIVPQNLSNHDCYTFLRENSIIHGCWEEYA